MDEDEEAEDGHLLRVLNHEFIRCPIRYLDPEVEQTVWLWREGSWENVSPMEMQGWPAKLVESLHYLSHLDAVIKEEAKTDGGK